MVSWKGAVALAAVLLALAGYLYFTRSGAAPAKSADLLACPPAQVVDISLTGAGGKATEALRVATDAPWSLVKPAPGTADSAAVDVLVSEVSSITATDTLKSPPGDSQLGLDSPRLTVRCTLAGGASYTLTVGGQNFDGSGSYARKDGSGQVYVISSATVDKFQQALDQPPVPPSPSPSGSPSPSPST